MTSEDSNKEIRMPLDSELEKKIQIVMNYYGIRTKTEIIRMLVTEKYRKIRKEEIQLKGYEAYKDNPIE